MIENISFLSTLLFVLVFTLLAMRVPIGVALGLPAVVVIFLKEGQVSGLAIAVISAMEDKFLLTAIPFFILASVFLTSGGASARIVKFAVSLVGHMRGGMAASGVVSCTLFAALSGSSPATVAAMGPLSIQGMRENNYPLPLAAGVICTAGTLGILIPPSIVMVVYCAATNESVGRMFLAGVVPGILAMLMLILAVRIFLHRSAIKQPPWAGWKAISRNGQQAFFGLLLILLILVGIYGGYFTPTEAAAFAAVYALFVATFVYRGIGLFRGSAWRKPAEPQALAVTRNLAMLPLVPLNLFHRDTREVLVAAAKVAIMLLFVIFNALVFSHALTELLIPQAVAETIVHWGLPAWAFLLILNLLLLVGGQFMEPSGLLLIVAPIVHPIALMLGIDPIHLGIIMVVNMEIGMITPPVGLNLFVTSSITGLGIIQVMRAALPWTAVLAVFLLLITYIPAISLSGEIIVEYLRDPFKWFPDL